MTTSTIKYHTLQHNNSLEDNLKIITDLVDSYLNKNQKEKFLLSVNDNKTHSFIINKSHLVKNENLNIIQGLRKSPLDEITYYHDEQGLGNSIFNKSGAIYMMDASSSIISYYLKDYVKENGLVLDLCAAPGGKSISLSLQRDDLFFLCNDISFSRVIEMKKNFNRLGLKNMISISSKVKEIEKLNSIFDLVILDAPCSGSGMIRKDKKMIKDYSSRKVETNVLIQKELLSCANKLLKNNGLLLYSTCSFNVKENEEQIEEFISKYNYEVIDIKVDESIIKGKHGYHLIPGIFDGEGIYFCLLRKKEASPSIPLTSIRLTEVEGISSFQYKNNYYVVSRMYKELLSLPLLSIGIKVLDDDTYNKHKYTHEFNTYIRDKYPSINISLEDATKYFNGEKLSTNLNLKDGYYFLNYNEIPISLSNKIGNKLQNLLPKRLR